MEASLAGRMSGGASTRAPSEAVLLARMASGDEHALGTMFDLHGDVAFGLALAIAGDESAAVSVVEDSFAELWR